MSKNQATAVIGLLFVIAGCLVMFVFRTTPPSEPTPATPAEIQTAIYNSPEVQAAKKRVEDIQVEQLKGFQSKIVEAEAEIAAANESMKSVTNNAERRELQQTIDYATKRIELNQRYIDIMLGKSK